MTTGPAVNTDTRMVAAGLAANIAVMRPPIITATGRAAQSGHAIVPAGGLAPFALLPHVDYIDDPDHRPGCGFVGGRNSSIAPLLASGAIPAQANRAVALRALPDNADAILRDLRRRAGLWCAPGALFARAAWTDTSAAAFLNRLRENGDDDSFLNFLNNFPVRIVASGEASIGDGVTVGSVSSQSSVSASYSIGAPLTISLEPRDIELDAQALDLEEDTREELRDRLIGAQLELRVLSSLPVGASAWIGFDPDALSVHSDPLLQVGPVDLPEPTLERGDGMTESTSVVTLSEAQIDQILAGDFYQGVTVSLPGTDGQFVTLRATDRLEISGFLRAQLRLGDR